MTGACGPPVPGSGDPTAAFAAAVELLVRGIDQLLAAVEVDWDGTRGGAVPGGGGRGGARRRTRPLAAEGGDESGRRPACRGRAGMTASLTVPPDGPRLAPDTVTVFGGAGVTAVESDSVRRAAARVAAAAEDLRAAAALCLAASEDVTLPGIAGAATSWRSDAGLGRPCAALAPVARALEAAAHDAARNLIQHADLCDLLGWRLLRAAGLYEEAESTAERVVGALVTAGTFGTGAAFGSMGGARAGGSRCAGRGRAGGVVSAEGWSPAARPGRSPDGSVRPPCATWLRTRTRCSPGWAAASRWRSPGSPTATPASSEGQVCSRTWPGSSRCWETTTRGSGSRGSPPRTSRTARPRPGRTPAPGPCRRHWPGSTASTRPRAGRRRAPWRSRRSPGPTAPSPGPC